MKIVFLDTLPLGSVSNLGELKKIGAVDLYEFTPPDKVVERVKDADVIITNKVRIDKKIMDQADRLKLICLSATGTDNIDVDHATRKGIEVKNVKGYSTHSVAQTTFSLIMYLLSRPAYYDQYVKSNAYSISPVFNHIGPEFWELNGKTFGIIGLGAIGKKVAEIAQAFGSKIIYYSTSGKNLENPYPQVSLNDLLKMSDIVSIHAPLNENTHNLIRMDELRLMKPSAILINAGRGGIINEKDLAKAIDEQVIAGAGLDVLEQEPIKPDNPLLQVKYKDNIIITPHIAWTSIEARELLMQKVIENIENFMKQKGSI